MDYIHFSLETEPVINFGSGLSSKYPAKCPLFRNLKESLQGDETVEVDILDELV